VGFGGAPVPVPDEEMEILRNRLSPLKIEPHPFIHVGDRVRVTSGALAGLEGILLQKKGQFRLVVCMDLIRQAMSVEVGAGQIEFVSRHICRPVAASISATHY
jgi:transcription termination/antitermination protein NusG